MRINFKTANMTFRFIKDNDKLYFYHPEGLVIFTKENVKEHIYEGANFRFEIENTEYIFASNIGPNSTENIIFSTGKIHLNVTRHEYWLSPKAMFNLHKLAYSLC